MSDTLKIQTLSHRELIELWTVTFGEPPPIVHDPPLMLALVEAALSERVVCDPPSIKKRR